MTCKRRGHMLHANERASAKSRQIFTPPTTTPRPRHFCCCLRGFPGDRDGHFHIRVSKFWLPIQPRKGSRGEAGQAPLGARTDSPATSPAFRGGGTGAGCCKGSAPPSSKLSSSQADFRDLLWEKLAPGHQPCQPHLLFVLLRY